MSSLRVNVSIDFCVGPVDFEVYLVLELLHFVAMPHDVHADCTVSLAIG